MNQPPLPFDKPSQHEMPAWDGVVFKGGPSRADLARLSPSIEAKNSAAIAAIKELLRPGLGNETGIGRVVLETTTELSPPPTTKKRRGMAVSRFFSKTADAKKIERFSDVSETAWRSAEPTRLAKSLFGREVVKDDKSTGNGKMAMLLKKSDGKFLAVALSPSERAIIKDNVRAYGRSAYENSLNSEKTDLFADPGAPNRAVIHTLEKPIENMKAYTLTLQEQEHILRQFIEALKSGHVGLARMGSEAEMLRKGSVLFENILPNMLDALADQRGWDAKQAELAERTVLIRMLGVDEKGKRQFSYSRNLCSALLTYTKMKIELFESKVSEAEEYTEENRRDAVKKAAGTVQ